MGKYKIKKLEPVEHPTNVIWDVKNLDVAYFYWDKKTSRVVAVRHYEVDHIFGKAKTLEDAQELINEYYNKLVETLIDSFLEPEIKSKFSWFDDEMMFHPYTCCRPAGARTTDCPTRRSI